MSSEPTDAVRAHCPVPDRRRTERDPARPRQRRQADRAADRGDHPAGVPQPDPRARSTIRPSSPFDGARIAFTTDSYVVTPIFFPGGDIGELAVNGTVNDLAMGGATPALPLARVHPRGGLPARGPAARGRVGARAPPSAPASPIVTGDTKVVGRGNGDKIFINTSGIGARAAPASTLSSRRVRPGDAILLSGTIGDHGMAILSTARGAGARGRDRRATRRRSTSWSRRCSTRCPDIHAMRDPTRGGARGHARRDRVAAASSASRSTRPRSRCARPCAARARSSGLDPLFVANEGKLVAFVPGGGARARRSRRCARIRSGRDAARIGTRHRRAPRARRAADADRRPARSSTCPSAKPLPRIC